MRFQSGILEKQARCPHTSRSKEIIAGQKTGDTVCDECGEAFAPGETIVPPDFRRGMIVSPHALLVALAINKDILLAKDVDHHTFVYDWALIDKDSKELVIPVAADVAAAFVAGGYGPAGL